MKNQITSVNVRCFDIPTQTPRETDGTFVWRKTTFVLAEVTACGQAGLGYTYADKAAAGLIHEVVAKQILGKDPFDIPAARKSMIQIVRNAGRPGIASRAIAALDVALWDLKSKILGVSLSKLLGQCRPSVAIYGSGGFTSYSIEELQDQLSHWVDAGISRVKMKIGGEASSRDYRETLERVRAARLAIGPKVELFVDANGAYEPRQALELSRRLKEQDVRWFEEPVSSDDLEGLAFVRDHAPDEIEIAAGEYGEALHYFDRMSASRAVDVIQIDVSRCFGITGFFEAVALCKARHLPISAHAVPQIHAHLCCSIPEARHLEYFFDHVRIESILFDGALAQKNGLLTPDCSRPGLGIDLKEKDALKYAA